jgi:hypothetical protein
MENQRENKEENKKVIKNDLLNTIDPEKDGPRKEENIDLDTNLVQHQVQEFNLKKCYI